MKISPAAPPSEPSTRLPKEKNDDDLRGQPQESGSDSDFEVDLGDDSFLSTDGARYLCCPGYAELGVVARGRLHGPPAVFGRLHLIIRGQDITRRPAKPDDIPIQVGQTDQAEAHVPQGNRAPEGHEVPVVGARLHNGTHSAFQRDLGEDVVAGQAPWEEEQT